MWFDDTPDQRIGVGRIEEALATGAKTVADGCPFCLTMVSDGGAAAPPRGRGDAGDGRATCRVADIMTINCRCICNPDLVVKIQAGVSMHMMPRPLNS